MTHVARLVVWPLVVAITSAGFVLGFATGHPVVALTFVPVATMLLLVALEQWMPAIGQSGALDDPESGHDVVHLIVGQGFGNQLGEALVAGALAVFAGWAGNRVDVALWPTSWPLALQVLLGVLLADGLEYVRHRAAHRYAWLWRIHELHHSLDRMHVLKSGRGHFLDMVCRHLTVFLPLAMIGTPTTVLLAYVAAVTALGGIGHANVAMRVPAFLHRIVMTPHVHRIHHARDVHLALANYANVFPLWDLLFGTFRDPTRARPTDFGIEHDTMPASLWGQMASPFVRPGIVERTN